MKFELFEIPDPFHPAVVHYPIVLTLLGTVLALGALLTRRFGLSFWTFLLFLLATIGIQYAVVTGQQQHFPQANQVAHAAVRDHAEWGEQTRTFDLITTVAALVSLAVVRLRRVQRLFASVTLGCAVLTSYNVLKTAENGGKLVYDLGIGVNAPAPVVTPAPGVPAGSPSPTASLPARR
ncbi:MAG TPA: DUF2231 domain-containing protein [Chthoniobacterales bacterium]